MLWDCLISTPVSGTLTACPEIPGHRVCYVEASPMIDVMFDQLEYLLVHGNRGCPAGCEDCVRLKQVEAWLLQPFRETASR